MPGLFGSGASAQPSQPFFTPQRTLAFQGLGDILRGGSGAQYVQPFLQAQQRKSGQDLWSNIFSGAQQAAPQAPAVTMASIMGAPGPQGYPAVPVTPGATLPDLTPATGQDLANRGAAAQMIRQGLIERGVAPHVADGFILNFQSESNLDPTINEISPLVPGSRGGFGLAQWTGPRRVALEQFAQQTGRPVGDVDTQLDFLVQELQGPEASAAQSIGATTTAQDAATAIARDYLRPAPENLRKRIEEYQEAQVPQSIGQAAAQLGQPPAQQALIPQAPRQPQITFDQIAQILDHPGISDARKQLALSTYQQQTPGPQEFEIERGADDRLYYVDKTGRIPSRPVNPGLEAAPADEYGRYTQEELAAGRQPLSRIDYALAKRGGGTVVYDPTTGRPLVSIGGQPAGSALNPSSPDSMIASIEGILGDPALDSATGIFSFLQSVPGTPQRRFGARAAQLEGQAFLQAFESLKGGGQITEIEGRKATQAIGRLDTTQSPSDYRQALQELRDLLIKGRNRPVGWSQQHGKDAPQLSTEEEPIEDILRRYK